MTLLASTSSMPNLYNIMDDRLHVGSSEASGFHDGGLFLPSDDAYLNPSVMGSSSPDEYQLQWGNTTPNYTFSPASMGSSSDHYGCFTMELDSGASSPEAYGMFGNRPSPEGERIYAEPRASRRQRYPDPPRSEPTAAATTQSTSASSNGGRIPHTEVERKYRDGLNAAMERLRQTVPHVSTWQPGAVNVGPKPSKLTVISSAIDYIQHLERECNRLSRENGMLRGE